jgi:hypothetical protein
LQKDRDCRESEKWKSREVKPSAGCRRNLISRAAINEREKFALKSKAADRLTRLMQHPSFSRFPRPKMTRPFFHRRLLVTKSPLSPLFVWQRAADFRFKKGREQRCEAVLILATSDRDRLLAD